MWDTKLLESLDLRRSCTPDERLEVLLHLEAPNRPTQMYRIRLQSTLSCWLDVTVDP